MIVLAGFLAHFLLTTRRSSTRVLLAMLSSHRHTTHKQQIHKHKYTNTSTQTQLQRYTDTHQTKLCPGFAVNAVKSETDKLGKSIVDSNADNAVCAKKIDS